MTGAPGSEVKGRGLGRLVDAITATMGWISAVVLFVMMVLTFADVVGRYLIDAPIFGASEMIQFLLAMTIFSGLAVVNSEDSHIVVELFDHRVRQAAPMLYAVLVQGISILMMAVIVWQMFAITFRSYQLGSATIVLEWPSWIATGAVAVFAALSLIVQVASLLLAKPIPQTDAEYVE